MWVVTGVASSSGISRAATIAAPPPRQSTTYYATRLHDAHGPGHASAVAQRQFQREWRARCAEAHIRDGLVAPPLHGETPSEVEWRAIERERGHFGIRRGRRQIAPLQAQRQREWRRWGAVSAEWLLGA